MNWGENFDGLDLHDHFVFELTGPRNINLKVYGDPAGNQGSTAAAGKGDWNIVQDFLARCPDVNVEYHVPSSHAAVRDRI